MQIQLYHCPDAGIIRKNITFMRGLSVKISRSPSYRHAYIVQLSRTNKLFPRKHNRYTTFGTRNASEAKVFNSRKLFLRVKFVGPCNREYFTDTSRLKMLTNRTTSHSHGKKFFMRNESAKALYTSM